MSVDISDDNTKKCEDISSKRVSGTTMLLQRTKKKLLTNALLYQEHSVNLVLVDPKCMSDKVYFGVKIRLTMGAEEGVSNTI
jgi:hypothetical protein